MSRFLVFQGVGFLVAEPPVLDGRLDAGEWPLERAAVLEHGQLVVVHDSVRLYLLLNLQADTEEDAADRVTVLFDVDGNGAPSPGVDRRFVVDSSSPKLLVEDLQGPGTWAPSPLRTASARAAGFGGFFADGTRTLRPTGGSEPTSEHRVWELAIDLSEIDSKVGETARFRVLVESTTPSIQEWYPPGPGGIAGGLEVGLPGRFVEVPGGPTGSGPVLGSPPLEVTQAVQTVDNALPLVSEKATVARVYVTGGGTNGLLTVQLHASRGGADLSGSPLVQVLLEQPGTTREDLGHTANFLLPDGWPEGDVELQAVERDSFGRSATSDVIPISFTCKETPTYWIVPADLGSGAMAPASTIATWQSYLETIFPVPRIDWVQQPSLGVVAEDDLIDELAEYRAGWLLVWLLGVLATQQEPFPFPDQVIGVVSGAVNAGGRSDPFWSTNGDGVDQGTVC